MGKVSVVKVLSDDGVFIEIIQHYNGWTFLPTNTKLWTQWVVPNFLFSFMHLLVNFLCDGRNFDKNFVESSYICRKAFYIKPNKRQKKFLHILNELHEWFYYIQFV